MDRQRKNSWAATVVVGLGWLIFLGSPSAALAGRDAGLTSYEGSKTCLPCHLDKAKEVHASAHYQFKGSTPEVANLGVAGKLGGINDFCTYPNINWMFEMTNLSGQKVIAGCASCHVGMGKKPTAQPTQAQLENIDCLMCHSETYKRKGQLVNGQFQFVPDPAVDMLSVLRNIQAQPTKATCLTRCHSGAGGGQGLKQGDMDPALALATTPKTLDVHLSAQGANLNCLSCHTTQNHRIAGRGNDIRQTDLDVKVACNNCHGTAPHDDAQLNRHTARVDCTVCHIPAFARNIPTDVSGISASRMPTPRPIAMSRSG